MLTDAERAEFERRIQELFAAQAQGQGDELLAALGNPPDIASVPSSFWDEFGSSLAVALTPVLTEMAIQSAVNTYAEAGLSIGIDWALVNQRAATWASGYTFGLVSGINEHSQSKLQEWVTAFFETPEQDITSLGAQIAELFGPVRGDAIAITEVTRAAAEGEGMLINEIKRLNPKADVDEFWQTSTDEMVCRLICRPLNGVRGDGQGNFKNPKNGKTYRIPGHPRCRCGRRLQWRVARSQ